MDLIKNIDFWVTFVSRFFSIFAAGIAIFLFFFKRTKISTVIQFILNYSKQITLNELKFKFERLNDFTTKEEESKNEIINILGEIEGQILGNEILKKELEDLLNKIHSYISNPRTLSEPNKRSLVSEMKESIRNIDVSNYNNIVKK